MREISRDPGLEPGAQARHRFDFMSGKRGRAAVLGVARAQNRRTARRRQPHDDTICVPETGTT